ncbi:MAG: hypothetical protein COB53_12740, partial [Elusimicrobia bacterium]
MSRATKIFFTAGVSCLMLAFALNIPPEAPKKPTLRRTARTYRPVPINRTVPNRRTVRVTPKIPTSLSNVSPRAARTIRIPSRYRSRIIAQPRIQRELNSEQLLKIALRQLAQELTLQKQKTRQQEELDIIPIEDIAEEVVEEKVTAEDPLAHLPAIRRRP